MNNQIIQPEQLSVRELRQWLSNFENKQRDQLKQTLPQRPPSNGGEFGQRVPKLEGSICSSTASVSSSTSNEKPSAKLSKLGADKPSRMDKEREPVFRKIHNQERKQQPMEPISNDLQVVSAPAPQQPKEVFKRNDSFSSSWTEDDFQTTFGSKWPSSFSSAFELPSSWGLLALDEERTARSGKDMDGASFRDDISWNTDTLSARGSSNHNDGSPLGQSEKRGVQKKSSLMMCKSVQKLIDAPSLGVSTKKGSLSFNETSINKNGRKTLAERAFEYRRFDRAGELPKAKTNIEPSLVVPDDESVPSCIEEERKPTLRDPILMGDVFAAEMRVEDRRRQLTKQRQTVSVSNPFKATMKDQSMGLEVEDIPQSVVLTSRQVSAAEMRVADWRRQLTQQRQMTSDSSKNTVHTKDPVVVSPVEDTSQPAASTATATARPISAAQKRVEECRQLRQMTSNPFQGKIRTKVEATAPEVENTPQPVAATARQVSTTELRLENRQRQLKQQRQIPSKSPKGTIQTKDQVALPKAEDTTQSVTTTARQFGSSVKNSSVQKRREALEQKWAEERAPSHKKKVQWMALNGNYRKKVILSVHK